jgi:hypothetical protein
VLRRFRPPGPPRRPEPRFDLPNRRPTLWFITPAFRRAELSAICFAQRAAAIETLAGYGIDASACVIADDENLDLADEYGFASVERDNRFLGQKLNDGYQFAAAESVDYVCPMGSDSWIDPAFIAMNLPGRESKTVVSSRHYSVVRADGRRRAQLFVDYQGGTTMFFPTRMLRHCDYRPVPEDLQRGCDGNTIRALKSGGPHSFRVAEVHELETVAFQSPQLQITDYAKLLGRWGVGETEDTFADLADRYPAELVERVERLYEQRRAGAGV